jgi:hypothetical protein
MRKKYTMFKNGAIHANEEDGWDTICHQHRLLGKRINKLNIDENEKASLLDNVDVLYDMGKRMADRLKSYHDEAGRPGNKKWWTDGFFAKK